jgi:hypothetical protein
MEPVNGPFASLTSLANLSVWSRIWRAICSSVLPIGSAPISRHVHLELLPADDLLHLVGQTRRHRPGVAAGASTPDQGPTSKPARPDSASVGTSGSAEERCAVVTARLAECDS